jgi:aspartate 1-decarboxylase
MLRIVAKSKIQRPRVTGKNLAYEGSIAVDRRLLTLADMIPGELVQVVNVNNGARFETYLLSGRPGEVCLNGAAARLGEIGDPLIVISYALMDSAECARYSIRVVAVDDRNCPVKRGKRRAPRSGSSHPE